MEVEDDAPVANKRRAVKKQQQPQDKGGKKGSILNRLGKAKDGNAGIKVLVKNLKFDILEDDVTELFATVGKVTKAEIVYDRSGRSKGLARVWFARKADAEKAIKEYDGMRPSSGRHTRGDSLLSGQAERWTDSRCRSRWTTTRTCATACSGRR